MVLRETGSNASNLAVTPWAISRQVPSDALTKVSPSEGQKTAVLIDLKRHAQIWEDFYDSVVAQNRVPEPQESLDAEKARLRRLGKLRD